MKKKVIWAFLMVTAIVFLGACNKKEAAKVSAEAFMNAEFYLKDFDQYEKSFGKKIVESDDTAMTEQLAVQLAELGLEEDESKKAADAMFTVLQERTSYQVKVVKETQDEATIELTIKGLATDKFEAELQRLSIEKIIELVTSAGIENVKTEEDLRNLTSKADLDKAKQVVDEFHEDPKNINEIMVQAIADMEMASEPKVVTLVLETNKERKKYWEVNDEQRVINEITHILVMPY
ncbi:DUF5105 domain-containing protein [Vagococcus sp. BWB3-3]|uniref:DUF5105 domain-containing protein n=1 Tax=Vagococcus allomyrinae TaxID=2794353 RepID=A0A940SV81_9ENTE|nr:DUF5105 domain-containing protein [Vagococcus allomyrinae]MBP1042060.1 DUF5105 domain-containing protein [Vagococcus allomyrinae]